MNDTILALATPQGSGAIAIIRLSGSKAISTVDDIFYSKKKLIEVESQKIVFGTIKKNEDIIDEVLVSVFRNPKSYTGEDTVEISCHGSSFIIQSIIELLIEKGVRLATAGEFTQRAFLNGKLDLAQAEAVADLIASENKASHTIALQQMRGGVSNELSELREALIHFTALIELELDFGEEDVEFADRAQLYDLIKNLQTRITKLMASFEYGNAIKNGVPVAIIGKPNAGKSTLLNTLLNEERAIVSSIAGTTRDTIEEILSIDGIQFRFIDTAGLRDSDEEIEKIGIEKSKKSIEKADIIFYLSDYNEMKPDQVFAEVNNLKLNPAKTILICNKIDTGKEGNMGYIANYEAVLKNFGFQHLIFISAKEKLGIDTLKNELISIVRANIDFNQVIISNSRHFEALRNALKSLNEVENGMTQQLSEDLLSFHLRDTLKYIGEITGNIDVDKDILGAIFGKFCIGK